jgi:hypothetical protein
MWRENFGKKLLEDRVRGRFGDTAEDESSSDQKPKLDKNIKSEFLFNLNIIVKSLFS